MTLIISLTSLCSTNIKYIITPILQISHCELYPMLQTISGAFWKMDSNKLIRKTVKKYHQYIPI